MPGSATDATDANGGQEERSPRSPRFGQEGGELSYGSYLRIPELLQLQSLLSDPPAHDELLFIVVHQAYELWFKQALFELESVREVLFAGDTHAARHYLKRVHTIEQDVTDDEAPRRRTTPYRRPAAPRHAA